MQLIDAADSDEEKKGRRRKKRGQDEEEDYRFEEEEDAVKVTIPPRCCYFLSVLTGRFSYLQKKASKKEMPSREMPSRGGRATRSSSRLRGEEWERWEDVAAAVAQAEEADGDVYDDEEA